MAREYRIGQLETSEELNLFVCLHALDSAFDRILRALRMLDARMLLPVESVQSNCASIEAIRTAVNLEVRETLGESSAKTFDDFSRNLKQMENQLIAECMDEACSRNVTEADV